MDYSVGSLSDLITGATTPNKKKVVKKQITSKDVSITENAHVEQDLKPAPQGSTTRTKKKKTKSAKQLNKIVNDGVEGNKIEGTTKLAGKKRKLTKGDDNLSTPKRSINDENAERRVSLKEKVNDKIQKLEEDPELLSRTVFVGNLPITLNTKQIKKRFMKFGNVETVRIRGIPVANPKTPKKVAVIKKEFHPDRKSVFGFVRFEKREDAIKASEANGIVYKDHHLRIHLCDVKEKPDDNKAIFVGNLSFYAEEDDLWKTFESCGSITSVRIVRDGRTGIGKGFGYVNFENSDSVTLALEMENVKLKDRELRISICNNNAAKKKLKNKKAKIAKAGKPKNPKRDTTVQEESVQKKEEGNIKEQIKQENVNVVNKPFQGTKFIQKKKQKFNKGLLQKKKKSKQIAPK